MKVIASLGALLFSGFVAATPLHNVVVFGDSLSDNGNLYQYMNRMLPQSPPYYEGRFSNGPVWIELVMATYFPNQPEKHMLNYAYGGAGVSEDPDDDGLFTLRREINTYLSTHNNQASDDSLYVVWIGANNYLGMPPEEDKTLKAVNDGIVHGLQNLADKGAKHFLVINIPDVGKTPAAVEFDAVDLLTRYADRHNEMLLQSVEDLKKQYPDVKWHFYDMNTTFKRIIDFPAEFGIKNVKGTCYNSLVDKGTKPSVLGMVAGVHRSLANDEEGCDDYLFFDLVHPTAIAHRILADRARALFDEEGIEFSE